MTALEAHLRDGPCNVYPSDMRLYVNERTYLCPGMFAICDEDMDPNRIDERDTVLVAEVRSASTSDFDRGDKFGAYRQLPSLREYLPLDNRKIQAMVFRLGDDGEWRHVTFSGGADFLLASIGLQMWLQEIYDGIPLDRE